MSFLYINEQNSEVSVDGGYCVVTTPDTAKRLIPIESIEYASIFGKVHITTPALQMFMKNKIIVTIYSNTGQYFGRIVSNENVNIARQRKQFKLSGDTYFSLNLAKKLIKAKINNQIIIMYRYCPKGVIGEEIKELGKKMRSIIKKIDNCKTVEEIMGHEGIAARYYFSALSKSVVPEFKFNGRSRRPPKDEFNSMLSLGYSILMNEIYGAVEGKGMNVYAGFLHQDRENHPTVASDLLEEWRSVIVDSMVLSLVNGREIHIEDFEKSEDGVFLLKNAMKTFIKKYETKMRTSTSYVQEQKMSFRRAIWQQTALLAKAIDNEDYSIYEPIIIR